MARGYVLGALALLSGCGAIPREPFILECTDSANCAQQARSFCRTDDYSIIHERKIDNLTAEGVREWKGANGYQRRITLFWLIRCNPLESSTAVIDGSRVSTQPAAIGGDKQAEIDEVCQLRPGPSRDEEIALLEAEIRRSVTCPDVPYKEKLCVELPRGSVPPRGKTLCSINARSLVGGKPKIPEGEAR